MFVARQIANNLLPIPKKILTFLLALCIILSERTSNNLACALQFFLCFFLLVLLCSKQAFQTKIWPKKVLKLSYFWKKRKNVFAFCCDPRPKSQILTPHPCPLFRKLFFRCIDQWTKTFCKKPVGQKPVNRPVHRGRFWNLSVGSGQENPDRFHLCHTQPILF